SPPAPLMVAMVLRRVTAPGDRGRCMVGGGEDRCAMLMRPAVGGACTAVAAGVNGATGLDRGRGCARILHKHATDHCPFDRQARPVQELAAARRPCRSGAPAPAWDSCAHNWNACEAGAVARGRHGDATRTCDTPLGHAPLDLRTPLSRPLRIR